MPLRPQPPVVGGYWGVARCDMLGPGAAHAEPFSSAASSPDIRRSGHLPPGDTESGTRRYPVVYLLHGFTDSDADWFGRAAGHWIHLPTVLDRAFADSDAVPMIVVMPNASNTFEGSFYTASVTTGDWEAFVADELVAAIDQRYRTRAERSGRGLAGHSMGGYGAIRLAMKRPDVFSSVYALSACCLTLFRNVGGSSVAETITSADEIRTAEFLVEAALAQAAAFSPTPGQPALLSRPADA
jgi:S-formylglutathione hydrolase